MSKNAVIQNFFYDIANYFGAVKKLFISDI